MSLHGIARRIGSRGRWRGSHGRWQGSPDRWQGSPDRWHGTHDRWHGSPGRWHGQRNRWIGARGVWLACALLASGCTHEVSAPPTEAALFPFNAREDLQVQICPWFGGASSALSFSFDDTRATSHIHAAPILEEYGYRGTFNLNTKAVGSAWAPWIDMWRKGHELGNHTWSHPRLTDIPVAQARQEIERGRADLLANVPGLSDVVTFVYPEGQSNPDMCAIVLEQHLCARGAWGWNSPQPADYSLLSSRGWRGVMAFEEDLAHSFSRNGWMIMNFHGVVEGGPPEEEFRTLLRIASQHRDSLWVAPLGQIAKYTLARARARLQVVGDNPATIILAGIDGQRLADVALTLRISTSVSGVGLLEIDGVHYPIVDGQSVMINHRVGATVKVTARAEQ